MAEVQRDISLSYGASAQVNMSSPPKRRRIFFLSNRFFGCTCLRSSLKSKNRNEDRDINGNSSLPEKMFKGTFVVFTVIALLELPAGVSKTLDESTLTSNDVCQLFSRSPESKKPTSSSSGKAAWFSAIERRKSSQISPSTRQRTQLIRTKTLRGSRRARSNETSAQSLSSWTQRSSRKTSAWGHSPLPSAGCRSAT